MHVVVFPRYAWSKTGLPLEVLRQMLVTSDGLRMMQRLYKVFYLTAECISLRPPLHLNAGACVMTRRGAKTIAPSDALRDQIIVSKEFCWASNECEAMSECFF